MSAPSHTPEANQTWRSAFLAEASYRLASSIEWDATLANATAVTIPELADWTLLHLLETEGNPPRLVASSGDPFRQAIARELEDRVSLEDHQLAVVASVVKSAESELFSDVSDEDLRGRSQAGGHRRLLDQLGAASAMIVPLPGPEGVLGALSLISRHREYDTEDLACAEDLGRRIGLAVHNARLYALAKANIQARQEFVASIYHDLNNPLTSIKAIAEFLEKQSQDGADLDHEWLRQRLGRIDASANRMSAILRDLLDTTHLEAGQPLELDLQRVDLAALVRRVAAQVADGTHQIHVAAPAPGLTAYCDAARMERVLDNLVGNAVKYSPPERPVSVEVGRVSENERDWATVSVTDLGIGIPAADLPMIFRQFHRAKNVGRVPGNGLGLFGSAQIVKQHGGTIEVRSQEGKGSVFTLRLPANAGETRRDEN